MSSSGSTDASWLRLSKMSTFFFSTQLLLYDCIQALHNLGVTPLNGPASAFSPERAPTAGGDRLGLGASRVRAMDTVWIPVTGNMKIAQLEFV